MTKLSIITTFYNAEKFIVNCINSITQQKFDPKKIKVEYLLINDCSTDNTLNIVKAYLQKEKHPDIKYRIIDTPENLGCGGARKFGIDNSNGDYLMFLDADDYYIHNNFIARAVKDITEIDADIVEYGLVYNKKDGKKIPFQIQHDTVIENNPIAAVKVLFSDNLIKFNVWTKIIKKSLTDKFPYSEKRTFEDVETIPVWVYMANKIAIKSSCEINYRVASKSITTEDSYNTRLGTVQAIASHFERFKDHKDVLISMYSRAMIDLDAVLNNKTNHDSMFNKMSKLNRYMLSYIYPETYQEFTDIIE